MAALAAMPRLATRLVLVALTLACGCAGVPAAPSPVAPSAPTAATTTADGARRLPLVRRNGFLLAPVTIDGRLVGDFLVDTGAGATFIDRGLADALHLPELVDAQVQGAHFTDTAQIRELHRLAAGGIALVAAPTVALDLAELQAQLGSTLAGVIGFPTFGGAPFTIDFVDDALVVHDPVRFTPPAPTSELLRINQVPYVEATLENGIDVWLLLDTGSLFGLTLWREFVKDHGDVLTVPQKRWVQTSGIGGGTQVMESEVRALRVFGHEHGNVPVLIQDAPPHGWRHPRVAGRIGVALLERFRITMDPNRRRIWVTP